MGNRGGISAETHGGSAGVLRSGCRTLLRLSAHGPVARRARTAAGPRQVLIHAFAPFEIHAEIEHLRPQCVVFAVPVASR